MLAKGLIQNGKHFSKLIINTRSKYTLPDLPYGYSALEPIISGEIMQFHHQKHHATYVNNLNIAVDKLAEAQAKNDLSGIIALEPVLRFNGGGHLNHSLFWNVLTPNGTSEPQGALAEAINRDFGSFNNLVTQLTNCCVPIQGSGWGWLGYNKQFNRLEVRACANQDPLLTSCGLHPLFGIDVWEHAYYLQYKNNRAEYVKNIFKIANWRRVEEYFENARK